MVRIGRRAALRALAGSAGLVLLGCSATDRPAAPSGTPVPSAPPTPDELVRRAGVAAERALVEAYERTLGAHPALAARLEPVVAHHRAHLDALGGAAPPSPPSGAPSATASAGSPPAVPADPAAAVEQLAAAEDAAAAARTADCLAAEDGELARLLASVAACEALHRDALRAAA